MISDENWDFGVMAISMNSLSGTQEKLVNDYDPHLTAPL